MRILRAVSPEAAAIARATATAAWREGARVLKHDHRAAVRIAAAGDVVAKTWPTRKPKALFLRCIGYTHALRHWRSARTLDAAGIATAAPLALLRTPGEETLVMRAAHGPTLLRVLDDAARGRCAFTFAQRRALAFDVGAQVRAIAATRRFNRDHKPSNIVVEADPATGALTPTIIDLVALRPDRQRIGGARMLASLMIEPIGCDCPPSRTMRMRALKGATDNAPRVARKTAWRMIELLISTHPDPRPEVDPLAAEPHTERTYLPPPGAQPRKAHESCD
ncbi:MAG: hypothetical protein EA379_06040 [Phycisphaerales bacterium]|nr:MAG: hypothetical protein EA379_06040 [Phycisphaerales bacterium]